MNPDQITQLYQQYLGRTPSADEIQGWVSGQYGGDPASQIPQSGEAQAYAQKQGSVASPAPGGPVSGAPIAGRTGGGDFWSQNAPGSGGTGAGTMPSGIDPALWSIYQKAGVSPAGRGTGFADWQYWQGVGPSQYDRLSRDLAGTGTDQPTDTPGQGAWQSSGGGGGGNAGGGGGGQFSPVSPFSPGGFTAPGGAPGAYSLPTVDQFMANDPGLQARMKMGTDAIQNSAAAKGSILNGGTLKALDRYAQDYGSNEYNNYVNQTMGAAGFNENQYGNRFNQALAGAGFNNQAGQQGYQNRYGQYSDYMNWLLSQQQLGNNAASSLYQSPAAI